MRGVFGGLILLFLGCTTHEARDRCSADWPSGIAPPSRFEGESLLDTPIQINSGVVQRILFSSNGFRGGTRTAWLRESEDLDVVFDVALASDASRAREIHLALLIDAVQWPINGQPFQKRTVEPGEMIRFSISLHGAELSKGGHSGHLLMWAPGRPYDAGFAFTIMHDGVDFDEIEETPSEKTYQHSFASEVTRVGSEWPLQVESSMGFQPEETLPLRALVKNSADEGCDDLAYGIGVVAMLDGRQIELGELGAYAAVALHERETAVLDFVLEGLPQDGEPHLLQLWQLPSLFMPTQFGTGPDSTRFNVTEPIAWLVW